MTESVVLEINCAVQLRGFDWFCAPMDMYQGWNIRIPKAIVVIVYQTAMMMSIAKISHSSRNIIFLPLGEYVFPSRTACRYFLVAFALRPDLWTISRPLLTNVAPFHRPPGCCLVSLYDDLLVSIAVIEHAGACRGHRDSFIRHIPSRCLGC